MLIVFTLIGDSSVEVIGADLMGLHTLSIFHQYDALHEKNTDKLIIPFTLIYVVGCSSNQKNEVPRGYLATNIFDDGSKQFVYTVELPESTGQGKRGKGNGRPGNVSGQVRGSSNRGISGGVTAGTGGSSKAGKGRRGQQGRAGLLNDAVNRHAG